MEVPRRCQKIRPAPLEQRHSPAPLLPPQFAIHHLHPLAPLHHALPSLGGLPLLSCSPTGSHSSPRSSRRRPRQLYALIHRASIPTSAPAPSPPHRPYHRKTSISPIRRAPSPPSASSTALPDPIRSTVPRTATTQRRTAKRPLRTASPSRHIRLSHTKSTRPNRRPCLLPAPRPTPTCTSNRSACLPRRPRPQGCPQNRACPARSSYATWRTRSMSQCDSPSTTGRPSARSVRAMPNRFLPSPPPYVVSRARRRWAIYLARRDEGGTGSRSRSDSKTMRIR
ncbi:hypothetical protein ID866_6889 [Astraeus odoratus]|nr:hypothetical protein ID866_6889 [Astraeus odoratus]